MKQIHRVQNLELVASVLLFNLLIPAAAIQTDFNVGKFCLKIIFFIFIKAEVTKLIYRKVYNPFYIHMQV